jgi:hypothetical protein
MESNGFAFSDDEYRILRQSLFERFASSAAVPSEPSVIPTITTSPEPCECSIFLEHVRRRPYF